MTRWPGDRAACLLVVPSFQNKSTHDGDGGSTTEITCQPRHFCCRVFLDCCRQAERRTDVSAGREGSVSAVGPVALAVVSGLCLNKVLSKSLRWRGGRRLTGGPSVGKQARSAQVSLLRSAALNVLLLIRVKHQRQRRKVQLRFHQWAADYLQHLLAACSSRLVRGTDLISQAAL